MKTRLLIIAGIYLVTTIWMIYEVKNAIEVPDDWDI